MTTSKEGRVYVEERGERERENRERERTNAVQGVRVGTLDVPH
jgi:hypothetical protein